MKRISIQTTPEDRKNMVYQIQHRQSVKIDKISSRKSLHLVELSPGEVVQAEYSRRYHKITAVYEIENWEDIAA